MKEFNKSLLFTPEGVRDIYGIDCEQRNIVEKNIKDIMKLYGFKNIKTPTFEFFDIFRHDNTSVSSKELFKFFDQYNNTLVLRPDITPSIARCVAKYYEEESMQIRLCYTGNTFLHRSGYQGKLCEITQIGAELLNDDSSDADGEMITLTIEALKKIGLKDFKVDLGHAGVFEGLIEEADLSDEEISQLKAYLSNRNIFAVEEMFENKNVSASLKELITKLPDLFGGIETLEFAKERSANKKTLDAIERLEKIYKSLEFFGLTDYVTFDLGMLSTHEYYTGLILKAYTYGTGDAIVSGGRYDKLIEKFGKDAPAIGLAFNLDELMTALRSEAVEIDSDDKDILILYRSANRKKAFEICNEYRNNSQSVRLMRKDAQVTLDKYKEYGLKNEVAKIIYIDDTGAITEIEL